MQTKAKVFNNHVRSLEDAFYLNQFLMTLFMLDQYLNTADKPTQIKIGPKVRRLITTMRQGVLDNNEDGTSVIRDSSIAGSNLFRLYNEQAELTKAVREANKNKWTEALRNKRRTDDSS